MDIPSITTPISTPAVKMNKTSKVKTPKALKIVLIVLIALVGITAAAAATAYLTVYIPAKNFYEHALQLKSDAGQLQAAIADKDLKSAGVQVANLKSKASNLNSEFKRFSYMTALPYAKDYYADGQRLFDIVQNSLDAGEIVIEAVTPYQDFLGLKGASTDSGKTTQDRINFLTESIEGILPHLNSVESKIAAVETSLDEIDPNRYPETYKDFQIRSTLLKAKETVADAHRLIKNGQPILAKTSWLLGKDAPRNYMMIFQNDAELRPSGGFWTAYGTIKVDKGKITPGISDDIYALDAKYNSSVPAPRPIKAYHINVPYLNIRDMNLSPDFPTDIEQFLTIYNKISGDKTKYDAVVAIDTKDLVDLVRVLGRVGVSGWGNFSADPDKRCDGCPQIIYQLEELADKPRNYIVADRKGFMGPLMNSLLSNAMGSEKSKMAPLAEAALNDVLQKHVLFYFTDAEVQKAAVTAGIAGSVSTPDANTDYFQLVDANMASAKSNLFITQKIKHEIITKDGKVNHKVTVTYTNPSKASNCNLEKGDLCLNASKYRDWFRFYVSPNSTMTKMTGSEVEPVVYDELGKKVFEGFYGNKYPLYAQASVKTSIQYTSSVPATSNYTLMLQKQPGTKSTEYEIWVNGQKQEAFTWDSDKIIKLAL